LNETCSITKCGDKIFELNTETRIYKFKVKINLTQTLANEEVDIWIEKINNILN
jgi:hypothetical protein